MKCKEEIPVAQHLPTVYPNRWLNPGQYFRLYDMFSKDSPNYYDPEQGIFPQWPAQTYTIEKTTTAGTATSTSEQKQANIMAQFRARVHHNHKSTTWKCKLCTFENQASLMICDICKVGWKCPNDGSPQIDSRCGLCGAVSPMKSAAIAGASSSANATAGMRSSGACATPIGPVGLAGLRSSEKTPSAEDIRSFMNMDSPRSQSRSRQSFLRNSPASFTASGAGSGAGPAPRSGSSSSETKVSSSASSSSSKDYKTSETPLTPLESAFNMRRRHENALEHARRQDFDEMRKMQEMQDREMDCAADYDRIRRHDRDMKRDYHREQAIQHVRRREGRERERDNTEQDDWARETDDDLYRDRVRMDERVAKRRREMKLVLEQNRSYHDRLSTATCNPSGQQLVPAAAAGPIPTANGFAPATTSVPPTATAAMSTS